MHRIRPAFFIVLFALAASLKGFAQVKGTNPADTALAEEAKESDQDNIPIVSLDDNDGQDGSAQNISGQLTSGRNAFLNAANFQFSAVRFRLRGYDADLSTTYMNGVPMESLDNGFTPYGLWGGLTDVLRNRVSTQGMQPLTYGIGEIGGSTFIDTRAFKQYKQTKITYSLTNRTYTNRVSISHSTGMSKKGWAFSIAGSRRWAEEGYADGTYYNGLSFYGGADKKINEHHMLSLVVFATPTESGRQGGSVEEMYDIVGSHYYNPYWGYQNGKKRNSSIARTSEPFGILSHDWKINKRVSLLSAASFTSGIRATSALDWYNANDPRPDYYRYLPSYQDDPNVAAQVAHQLQTDVNTRQIDWDKLYQANNSSYGSVSNANGITGNTVAGKRAEYFLEDRTVHTNRYNFNTTMNAALTSHIDFSGGLTYQNERNHYYERMRDLLGADFYVDVDQFAERDFPSNFGTAQADMNNPNRIIHEGDHFGYNYNINIQHAAGWGQALVKFKKVNFFVSAEHSYTQFYREGFYKNGLNPDNSFGKSVKQNFYNYNTKGGISYKLNTGNYFFANGSYQTKAPFFGSAYISPRTRDVVQNDLRSEQIASAEAGYVYNSPNVRMRVTGFYTQFRHGTDEISAYSDIYRTYVDYSLSNIGKTQEGVEVSGEVKLYKGLTLNGAASIGNYIYDTRQNLQITADNNSAITVPTDNLVYDKNFHVATPQNAYTLGLNYRSPKYYYLSVNVDYFDRMYLSFDPLRRTYAAVEGIDPKTPLYHEILDQTELNHEFSVDASAGYSWLMNKRFKSMRKRTFMTFSLNANNILNNKNIVSGGYEQLRFDTGEHDVNKYSPKLFYAYGFNFSANISVRF